MFAPELPIIITNREPLWSNRNGCIVHALSYSAAREEVPAGTVFLWLCKLQDYHHAVLMPDCGLITLTAAALDRCDAASG